MKSTWLNLLQVNMRLCKMRRTLMLQHILTPFKSLKTQITRRIFVLFKVNKLNVSSHVLLVLVFGLLPAEATYPSYSVTIGILHCIDLFA